MSLLTQSETHQQEAGVQPATLSEPSKRVHPLKALVAKIGNPPRTFYPAIFFGDKAILRSGEIVSEEEAMRRFAAT